MRQTHPPDSTLPAPVFFVSLLLQVSLESRGPESFKTPRGVCVPFGSMELALAERPAAEQQRFASLLAASETAGIAELDGIADEMQVGGTAGLGW